jgi:glycosyltransferase involved in cell wall biosynthesis
MPFPGLSRAEMEKKHNLSVAIITYNEELMIKDCIESVLELADEIIVLDSFSTDATEQICRSYDKVKFSQHVFDGYTQQKNRALDLCTCDWILSIDADERVSPQLEQSIRWFLAQNNEEIVGVKFPRLAFHMHKFIRHGGWYPNERYRLIRRGKARWVGEIIHEKLILDGSGKKIKGDLIHLTEIDLSDQINTINKYSSISALIRYNQGYSYRLWRLILKPISKFIELYIIKMGFLDKTQGFIIAISSSYASFLKEAKVFELDVLGSEKPSNLSDQYQKKRK